MKTKYPISKAEIALVSVHTGIAVRNIKDTLICNKNHHKKLEMILLGSIWTEEGLTKEDLKTAIAHMKLTKEYNGK